MKGILNCKLLGGGHSGNDCYGYKSSCKAVELSRGVKSRTEIIQRKLDHLKGPYYAYFILLIMFIFLKLHLQTLMFKTHVIFLIQQHHIHPLSKTFTPLSPSACYPVLIGQLNHSVVIGQLLSVSVGDGTPPTVTRFH